MTHQQQRAHDMFVAQNKTQKEIASALGISDKTLYNWIQRNNWHKERHMQQNMWTSFALSMSRQLRAFQLTIAEREEGESPSAGDVQLQCKMLNALLRLAKHGFHTADAVPDFVQYVFDRDTELGKQLTAHYLAYTEEEHRSEMVPEEPAMGDEVVEQVPPSIVAQPGVKETAPFSEHDFKQNKHLVKSLKEAPVSHTTRFRGRFVNSRWLQYNLFQYCLPAQQRRFIGDARKLLAEIDHTTLQQQITDHFTLQQTQAAA